MNLTYQTMEKLLVNRPVDRLDFIASLCRGRSVLDIGCYDETALIKRDTPHWLHGRLAAVAREVVGIDSSDKVPPEGIVTASNAIILRGDAIDLPDDVAQRAPYDVIVAGEFLEHLEHPLLFLRAIKTRFPGRELILSTPNGVSFANTLLGLIGREVQHPDHLQNFTFKILNTLCRRAGLSQWELTPYRFFATEMILASRGPRRFMVLSVERSVRIVERLFPLLSFGYIVRATL